MAAVAQAGDLGEAVRGTDGDGVCCAPRRGSRTRNSKVESPNSAQEGGPPPGVAPSADGLTRLSARFAEPRGWFMGRRARRAVGRVRADAARDAGDGWWRRTRDRVGGIARHPGVMGLPLRRWAPHRFFFSKSPEIEALWSEVLGKENPAGVAPDAHHVSRQVSSTTRSEPRMPS